MASRSAFGGPLVGNAAVLADIARCRVLLEQSRWACLPAAMALDLHAAQAQGPGESQAKQAVVRAIAIAKAAVPTAATQVPPAARRRRGGASGPAPPGSACGGGRCWTWPSSCSARRACPAPRSTPLAYL